MKPLYFFFILLFWHFNSISQKTLTNGIYILDGGKSNWYDNEFFVRFYNADSLIFGKLMSPEDTNLDSMGQYLNGLTYVKRAYQRKNDKINFYEEMNYNSIIIDYNILLASDSVLWLNASENSLHISEVPIRYKFINVDYLDRNIMYVDTIVYKVISDMPYPKTMMSKVYEKVSNAISQIDDAEDFDKCLTSITLIIMEDGTCTEWRIHRSQCWDIAEDILEEFKKTTPWNGGTHMGRRVKCSFLIPFKYNR
ncbi:MAG: hypothetical protein IPH94_01545 [Saprospiraceae bacterium]|nr:hypothetical protein [Saprospiraceae bacterium]